MLEIGKGEIFTRYENANTSFDVFRYTAKIITNDSTSGTTIGGVDSRDVIGTQLEVTIPIDVSQCDESTRWEIICRLSEPTEFIKMKLPVTVSNRSLMELELEIEQVEWQQVQDKNGNVVHTVDGETVSGYLTNIISVTAKTHTMWRTT